MRGVSLGHRLSGAWRAPALKRTVVGPGSPQVCVPSRIGVLSAVGEPLSDSHTGSDVRGIREQSGGCEVVSCCRACGPCRVCVDVAFGDLCVSPGRPPGCFLLISTHLSGKRVTPTP